MSDNFDTGEKSNDSDYDNSCDEMYDKSDSEEESNDSDYENTDHRFYNW